MSVSPGSPVTERDSNGVLVTKVPITAVVTIGDEVVSGSASIVATIRYEGKTTEIKTDGFWQVKSPFVLSPQEVICKPSDSANKSGVRSVVSIKSAAGDLFRVTKVNGLPDGIPFELDSASPAAEHSGTFLISSEVLQKPAWNRVSIVTDAAIGAEVPVTVAVLPAPQEKGE